MLSEADLRLLLDLLELREVYHDGDFIVCKRMRGYRSEVAPLQGKLSIMLEMVTSSKPLSPDERKVFNAAVKKHLGK